MKIATQYIKTEAKFRLSRIWLEVDSLLELHSGSRFSRAHRIKTAVERFGQHIPASVSDLHIITNIPDKVDMKQSSILVFNCPIV